MVSIQKLYNDILSFLGQKFYTKSETDTLLNGKSGTGHTHSYNNITDKPASFTPTAHTHGNLQNDGAVGTSDNANKNVVTDSNGKITTENKYSHPTYTARTGKPTGNLTPGFGETATISQITSDSTGHITAATDRTIKIPNTEATTSTLGLVKVDNTLSTTSTNPVQNKTVKTGLDSKLNSSDFLETLNNAILDMNDA